MKELLFLLNSCGSGYIRYSQKIHGFRSIRILEYWFTLVTISNMIQDYFSNKVWVRSREESTVYEDWISKKQYKECELEIPCRVSSLNYKDLQVLQHIDDVQVNVLKLHTAPIVEIKPTDYVVWKWESYQVIAKYEAQDKNSVRFNKYFIKLVKW